MIALITFLAPCFVGVVISIVTSAMLDDHKKVKRSDAWIRDSYERVRKEEHGEPTMTTDEQIFGQMLPAALRTAGWLFRSCLPWTPYLIVRDNYRTWAHYEGHKISESQGMVVHCGLARGLGCHHHSVKYPCADCQSLAYNLGMI